MEPQQSTTRRWSTDRIASQRMVLVKWRPPSGGLTGTCRGKGRTRDVIGCTTARPAGPVLKGSTERTNTGRRPPCSCPKVGSKSASQTSRRFLIGVGVRRLRPTSNARQHPTRPIALRPTLSVPPRPRPMLGGQPGGQHNRRWSLPRICDRTGPRWPGPVPHQLRRQTSVPAHANDAA
jgi:hypothetical protein